ncbi:hypothetical protein ES702_06241 [subsurface metagenome]
MPNILTLRGLNPAQIIHDAQLIKAVPIDDTDKGADKVLAYDQATAKLAYVPKCPEIVIKAIQHVTISFLYAATSHEVLINEVDMDNTFLIFGGFQSESNIATAAFARIELTDSTHILATRFGWNASLIINVCVIECTAGIKSVQRGTIHIGSETYHDATINQVDTDKTFVSYLGVTTTADNISRALFRAYLLNSTTVRAERDDIYSEMDISFEAVEFI